jgi:hypothetical protein
VGTHSAFSSTNTFHYNRSQDEFEQVMSYHWVTESHQYIQSLGFGTRLRPVNWSRRTSASTSGARTTGR